MYRAVILLASLALQVVGCGDKDESSTSQVEKSTVGEVVEEIDVTTESAGPTASVMAPETSGDQ